MAPKGTAESFKPSPLQLTSSQNYLKWTIWVRICSIHVIQPLLHSFFNQTAPLPIYRNSRATCYPSSQHCNSPTSTHSYLLFIHLCNFWLFFKPQPKYHSLAPKSRLGRPMAIYNFPYCSPISVYKYLFTCLCPSKVCKFSKDLHHSLFTYSGHTAWHNTDIQ